MGFLPRLVALIFQNDTFSTCHATGALWNLVVDNNDAKVALVNDGSFCKQLICLFNHGDVQVSRSYFVFSPFFTKFCRSRGTLLALRAKCVAKMFK
jgi:hypothetical protein